MIVGDPAAQKRATLDRVTAPAAPSEPVWEYGWRLSWCERCEDYTAHKDERTICVRCERRVSE